MLKSSASICAVLAMATMAPLPGAAATFIVDKNFWGTSTTTGSFAWAIHQANITPGLDAIHLYSDVSADDFQPTPADGGERYMANITDTAGLVIKGRGHSLTNTPSFITRSGVVHTKYNPAPIQVSSGDMWTAQANSFARVANGVASLVVDNLNVDGLNKFLRIGRDVVVDIRDSTFGHIGNFGDPGLPLISVSDDSTLGLKNVTVRNINRYQSGGLGAEFIYYPVIEGKNANLNIQNSMLDLFSSTIAGAVSWLGGTVNVVSSVITGKGLSIADDAKQGVMNVVNSLFWPYDHSGTARVQAINGGEANITASTIQFDASGTRDVPTPGHPQVSCPTDYRCNGAPLQAFDGGLINLRSSSISVLSTNLAGILNPYSNTFNGTPGTLTADASTFVQPVPTLDAAALKALFNQISLLTEGAPYALNHTTSLPHYLRYPSGAYPLSSGPLRNVVADADGANKLINPINGSVITRDVFGNPRTRHGLRDAGAVQAVVPGPLPLLGCGGALAWSRRLRRRLRQAAAA